MSDSGNWFESNPGKAKLLIFVVCFALLEGLVRVLVAGDLLWLKYYPTSADPQFWAYVDRDTGMWKHADTTFRHQSRCFDVTYTSNTIGARDVERNPDAGGQQRVFVLGDSFVEGWAVADADRFSNMLEQQTGIEHLNFGASGGFGTIQEWLLYRKWRDQFEHSAVMLFIFPDNDFNDNNPERFAGDIYRPFLRPAGESYEVWYPVSFADRDTDRRSTGRVIRNNIYMHSQLINVLITGIKMIDLAPDNDVPPSRYYEYSDTELQTMLFALQEIRALAEQRPLHIYLIPTTVDFAAADESTDPSPLAAALQNFAADREATYFTDLLPAFQRDAAASGRAFIDYTLGCDRHWNRLGHEIAAQVVLDSGPAVYVDNP